MKTTFPVFCAVIIALSIFGAVRFSAPDAETPALNPPAVIAPTLVEQEAPPPAPEITVIASATPIEKPGLENAYKVSETLYRSAQPTAEGFRQLRAMGIKTVVNLRSFHSDRDELGDTDLDYEHITMKAWHAEEKEVVRFLKIATDPERQPVFVHCQHGSDRTGLMVALYRVAVQGWTKDDALAEMTEGPFGFHKVFQNLVDYMETLDIDDIRRKAGIAEAPLPYPT